MEWRYNNRDADTFSLLLDYVLVVNNLQSPNSIKLFQIFKSDFRIAPPVNTWSSTHVQIFYVLVILLDLVLFPEFLQTGQ